MTVIWIVEEVAPNAPTLASSLMGDYAVRVFASLTSFATLLRTNRRQRPDLLVLKAATAGWDASRLQLFLSRHLAETPVVDLRAGAVSDKLAALAGDALRLSAHIDGLLRGKAQRQTLRYRDLVLDCERLQYSVLPSEAAATLPLKEAQLLRLFLQKPGVCLARQEIQAAIWDNVCVTPRTIDSHVSRLRRRLQDAEAQIESVYGGGYVLR